MSLISERLARHREDEKTLNWEGSFADYFAHLFKDPKLNQLSHARVFNMIQREGVEAVDENTRRYKFFDGQIFGLEKPLQQLVEYFEASAMGLEVRKRILLLMGPVGGGKSTIVTLLKRGLERYSRTEEGAVYAIKGCPMNEDPLHLVPDVLRPEMQKEYGLYIEGDLCPHCSLMLQKKYDGRHEDVKVHRIIFSEKDRRGIGTFSPSDPKSQDISELTGSIDLSTIGEYGVESDPRAYRFDGELNVANRGLMEFVEMLKCDEKFLYSLLTLSQEQNIKTGRFAMIYADEVLISHTNENEYNTFTGDKKKEALHDRIILIKVPYNLKVSEERKIYDKLLQQSEALQRCHIAPYTLYMAATFAILTRLEPGEITVGGTIRKATKGQKLSLYDGKEVPDFNHSDIEAFQGAAKREGMDGISPRYVINRISQAIIGEGRGGCVNPIDVLISLRDGLEQHTSVTPEMIEEYKNLIAQTWQEFNKIAKREVQQAFVYSFEDSAETLFEQYLDNIEAFCNKRKVRDLITQEEVDPDEKFMRSIEEQIEIPDNDKKTFREEILIKISGLARRGGTISYSSQDKLREAIEKKLFADLKDIVKIVTTARTPDDEQKERFNEVSKHLISQHGYCPSCANELLKYVGSLLTR